MTRMLWLAGAATFAGAILLMSWLSNAVWAQSQLAYPRPHPNACLPNVRNFGHFRTTWRQWPGERRPEQINPRSVGAETLPTPEGEEKLPLPKPAPPRTPTPLPDIETMPLPMGTILPPEGTLLPGNLLEQRGTGPKPSKPLIEGGLPGLLIEPAPSQPAMPPPKDAAKPSVDLNLKEPPESKDAPKPNDTPEPQDTPKPKESPPLPPPRGQAPQAWRDNRRQSQAMAAIFTIRDAGRGGVVSLAGGIEPERNPLLAGAYRADSISATMAHSLVDRLEPAAYATVESSTKSEVVAPPLVAFDGYCPVELVRNSRWAPGDLRWTVVYKGWIYRLSGAEQRQRFLANPDSFTPVNSGNDPVLSVDESRTVPGRPAYCAMYRGRLYMFSSAATQDQFNRSPQRYAAEK